MVPTPRTAKVTGTSNACNTGRVPNGKPIGYRNRDMNSRTETINNMWKAHINRMRLQKECVQLRKRFRSADRTLYHLDRLMKQRGISCADERDTSITVHEDDSSGDYINEQHEEYDALLQKEDAADDDDDDSIQSYAPAADCRICRVMRLQHPSTVCLDCNCYHLRKRCKRANPPVVEIEFDKLDLDKMSKETEEEKRKWEPIVDDDDDESYSSDCYQRKRKRERGSSIGSRKRKKFNWNGWFQRDLERHGSEIANANLKYRMWKRKVKPDRVGDDRRLMEYEKKYFQANIDRYQHSACRETVHPCVSPPATWIKRAGEIKPPAELKATIHALISIATEFCGRSERQNWERVLAPLPLGSTARTIWALLFLKSTNGVADTVTCNHFAKLVRKHADISWSDVHPSNIERVAAILRQTSKWVKNASSTTKILEDILINHDGKPPATVTEWLRYFEIGPKTASLLQWSLSGKAEWVPVDTHVWTAFRRWEWTTAKSPSECSWQALKWFPPEFNIRINDAIGAIRQTLRNDPHRRRAMFRKYANSNIIEMLRELDYK